ncbi:GNAT family N-acetyltransferase [Sphingomonas sp. H39-1-10]|uniref:GNAT family N-acetyltransferase n=1 Tax=Sphingomonas pollutisoli TaxID=3030829 RepID=UPI0023B97EE1|nr:GNAT family N-acetyltransferase [Sphingomonas pollutisoli]MDF0487168.1 GNAT family N-acetyltransferase [Sphingomonas pollutisoli]
MIETARLRLRPCRAADKAAFATILNTPAMMAHLGGVKTQAEIDALIDKRLADQARHGFSYWAVEERDGGALVGTCGVRIASNYPDAPVYGMHEAGWRIADSHWGRGYAREAAEASIAWAWANTDAPEIGAWTTIGNVASWRLMERLGMTRRPDLDFRRAGASEDAIVYAIRRPAAAPGSPRSG